MHINGKILVKNPQIEGKVMASEVEIQYNIEISIPEAIEGLEKITKGAEGFIDAMANSYRKVEQYNKEFSKETEAPATEVETPAPKVETSAPKVETPASKSDVNKAIRHVDRIVGDAFKETSKKEA